MDPELRDLVAHHWSVHGEATPLLGAGDECLIWRVAGPTDVAVRVSPSWRSKSELDWAFSVATAFGKHVPEVIAPLSAAGEGSVVLWLDQPVSVWPFVRGLPLDRDNPQQRREAGRLLAVLHRVASRIRRLGPRPASRRPVLAAPVPGLLSDAHLDVELDEWRSAVADKQPHGLVHGDFYRRNLLCRSDAVVGLLDWDDARDDYLETELAWSVWEFAKGPMDVWSPDRAADFLKAYLAHGGPVQPSRHVIPLIRGHLRHEVWQAHACHTRGEALDREYYDREIAAFWQLRGVELSA